MDTQQRKVVASAAFVFMSCRILIKAKEKKTKKPRRWWMTSLNKSRERYSGTNVLEDMLREPSGKFENFCRMSSEDFEIILSKLGPYIKKADTVMRLAIPIQERLAIALRFLASGDSFKSLSYLFKVSEQTVSRCVMDVCEALTIELKDEIKLPGSAEEWQKIAKMFNDKWNFPHCIGAIDGKHVVLQSPIHSGSEYFNYKGTFSLVLMALVDDNYCFTFVDVGCQGRISDGGVFKNTILWKKLEQTQLNLPAPEPLPSKESPLPYVIVADDAFPLTSNIMKPYSGSHEKGSKERIFNYRLSRARRIVENSFGIMASVFRVLRKPMLLQPDKAEKIVMTCTLLHNYLRRSRTSSMQYSPPGLLDEEIEGKFKPGSWRNSEEDMTSLLRLRRLPRKAGTEAKSIRENFAEFFLTTGKLEWQDSYC